MTDAPSPTQPAQHKGRSPQVVEGWTFTLQLVVVSVALGLALVVQTLAPA